MSENTVPGDSGRRTVDPDGIPQKPFEAPDGSTTVLLVRHGATQPARVGKPFPAKDGHGDPDLAPEGHVQATQVGRRLSTEHSAKPFEALYVTSLIRTHQTARPFVAVSGLTPRVEPGLREVHLGDYEGGLLRIKGAEGDPTVAEVYRQERWDVIPGAEPWDEFQGRCVEAVERIRLEHAGGRVIAVVHGGVIAAVLSHVTQSRRFAFVSADNTSVSEIVYLKDPVDRWILRRFNDTTHLAT